ncbi:MAG: CRTAC1 family protein [Acidobacteria bacterium]|nr:CRTAC1 family protein [Acidobacteriota bacterium]
MSVIRVAGLLALLVAGCGAAAAQVTFTDVTAQVFPGGLGMSHYSWGDCDGDGDDDLLVGAKSIYINGGPPAFTFTLKADTGDLAAGPIGGAQWFDIDNDGDLDIFGVAGGDNERLYLNDGTCRYSDISDADGNGDPNDYGDAGNSVTIAPGDYDADGYLDFFVGAYERNCVGSICADCTPDRLWHNLRNNKFQNVYGTLGLEQIERNMSGSYCYIAHTPCQSDADCAPYPADSCRSGLCARASQWVDYNNDGWLDLYVGNYRLDPNVMWENKGDGTFEEVCSTSKKNCDGEEDDGTPGDWGHTLGVDWADFDNDGDMDVYVADLAHGIYYLSAGHDISLLYASAGPGGANAYRFSDWRPSSGMKPYDPLQQPDWCETSPAWGDYDNDGDLDIYVTHIYDTSVRNRSTLYSNDGDRTFTATTNSHGFNFGLYHDYSASWCDYDQDGDLDLVTYGANAPTGQPSLPHLLRNDGGNTKDWVQVGVRGKGLGGSNSSGVGVRITAVNNNVSQIREINGNHGYQMSRSSSVQTFGFGGPGDALVDSLTVRWTTRGAETFHDVPMRARYTVLEGVAILRGTNPAQPLPRLAGGLFPYHDGVLGDGQAYFYLAEGTDQTLFVGKDAARGFVVLTLIP